MKIKINLNREVKDYFIHFFEKHFLMTPIYRLIDNSSASFEIIVDNQPELFVVTYESLFAYKSALTIESTANINFLESVYKILFKEVEINYNDRLLYILNEINTVNNKFKFFNHINLDNEPFFSFKSKINTADGKTYHSLCTKRYFRMTVNSNLYSIHERCAHFLTGRFDFDLNVKHKTFEFRCQLTSSSLDYYSADSVIIISESLDKFEKSVKRCKKQMTSMITNECFGDIVSNHNVSLKKLQTMTEETIKPYADLVHMSRI